MAEGLARAHFGDTIRITSAGSAPTRVNPYAIRAMAELGISLDDHESTSVAEIDPDGIDLVITLCAEEVCPVVFADVAQLHWPLTDPDHRTGPLTNEERLPFFREARDEIQRRIEAMAGDFKVAG